MNQNNDLEKLLETLIKMVGKANQNVDSLKQRVSQLELLMKEQQDTIHLHPTHPPVTHTRIVS